MLNKIIPAFMALLVGAALVFGQAVSGTAHPISLPSGALIFSTGDTCPLGTIEATDLVNRMPRIVSIASDTAGDTGGADEITPTGSVAAPVFTGSALGTHTHPYTEVLQHTHTVNVNDPGHNHVYKSQTSTTGAVTSYEHGALDTSSTASEATETVNTNTTGITASTVNPAGSVASGTTSGTSGGTPAGTNTAPAFTGNAFDNRPAFVAVIACRVE